eukprot:s338_g11.t2
MLLTSAPQWGAPQRVAGSWGVGLFDCPGNPIHENLDAIGPVCGTHTRRAMMDAFPTHCGIHDREGSQSSPRPRREEERARMPCDKEHKWPEPERQTPSAVDVYGSSPSPSASQALSPTQIEPYYSAIRRDAESSPQSTGRQSQELLREMKRLRQQMNELEQLAAGRHNASGLGSEGQSQSGLMAEWN